MLQQEHGVLVGTLSLDVLWLADVDGCWSVETEPCWSVCANEFLRVVR